MARKPYTCKECHVGPDVPAFKVYTASKHGNIFSARLAGWDFESVPWKVNFAVSESKLISPLQVPSHSRPSRPSWIATTQL